MNLYLTKFEDRADSRIVSNHNDVYDSSYIAYTRHEFIITAVTAKAVRNAIMGRWPMAKKLSIKMIGKA